MGTWAHMPHSHTCLSAMCCLPSQLCSALQPEDHAHKVFKASLGDTDVVSVDKLRLTFTADDPLPVKVAQLVQSNAPSASTTQPAEAGHKQGKCTLPELDPLYLGRTEEAERLCGTLRPGSTTRVLYLTANGGLGKSSLALDVGWRLWVAGQIAGKSRTPRPVQLHIPS